jgi:hypothetical protein
MKSTSVLRAMDKQPTALLGPAVYENCTAERAITSEVNDEVLVLNYFIRNTFYEASGAEMNIEVDFRPQPSRNIALPGLLARILGRVAFERRRTSTKITPLHHREQPNLPAADREHVLGRELAHG